MEDIRYSLYMHVWPDGKRYIGITGTTCDARWGFDGRGYRSQKELYAAIEACGWKNIEHRILINGEFTKEVVLAAEESLIDLYRSDDPAYGYNRRSAKPIVCIETGKRYKTALSAAQEFGGSSGQLSRHLHGKEESFMEFHFEFVA